MVPVKRFRGGETVTVLRGAKIVDPFSGEESDNLDWSEPEATPYEHCAVGPAVTDEPLDSNRVPVVDGLVVFGPFDMDVTARDRLLIKGEVYEVDGEPGFWKNPFNGRTPGCQIKAKKVSG